MASLDLPLDFLHRAAAPAVAAPWLLVLMHGVGSNEQDLFGLAPHVPPAFHVLSLRAPYPMGPGANAWFTIGTSTRGERVIDEAQEAASRALVAQAVASAAKQLGMAPERVVAGGFSQGGIMSLSLLLTQPALLRAAMVMHSRLLPQVLPLMAAPQALQGKSLWVSHGTDDQMIPLAQAHATREAVSRTPIALRYSEYPGGHEIRPAELQQAMVWLAELAAA